jgi:hypothetical protein
MKQRMIIIALGLVVGLSGCGLFGESVKSKAPDERVIPTVPPVVDLREDNADE